MNYTTAKPIDKTDIDEILNSSIQDFPGLKEAGISDKLMKLIKRGDVLVAKDKGEIVGQLIYRRSTGELIFMSVKPEYRKEGVARELFRFMCAQVPRDKEIYTFSFRKDDMGEEGPETYFTNVLGFKPRAWMEREGIPVQKFVYPR